MENIFTKRLKKLRKEDDITQQELAEELGVNRMTIVQWEKWNAQPNYTALRKLADMFEVDVSYLFGDDDFTLFLVSMADIYAKINYNKKHTDNSQIDFAEWITIWMPILSDNDIDEKKINSELERLGYNKKEMENILPFYPDGYNTKIIEYIFNADYVPTIPNGIKRWMLRREKPQLYYELIEEYDPL